MFGEIDQKPNDLLSKFDIRRKIWVFDKVSIKFVLEISRGGSYSITEAKQRLKGNKRKMKMPAESSIYWDSVGSQHSASVGSSGDACSSGSASRHYVDPWDLENYAYLRRHSVAGLAQQAPRHHRRPAYRLSQEARAHSEYWWVVVTKFRGQIDALISQIWLSLDRR